MTGTDVSLVDAGYKICTFSCGLVNRFWPELTAQLEKVTSLEFADREVGMAHFSTATMACGLGENPHVDIENAVRLGITTHFGEDSPYLSGLFVRYRLVWTGFPAFPFETKFAVPPMEHRHEALGIALLDGLGLESTVLVGDERFYNLYNVGVVGMVPPNLVKDLRALI